MAANACENDLLAINNNVCTKASIFTGFKRVMSAGSKISEFCDINGSFKISIISSGDVLFRILISKLFDKN